MDDELIKHAAFGLKWLARVPEERRVDALATVCKVWIESPQTINDIASRLDRMMLEKDQTKQIALGRRIASETELYAASWQTIGCLVAIYKDETRRKRRRRKVK